jgi:hypothetical protein
LTVVPAMMARAKVMRVTVKTQQMLEVRPRANPSLKVPEPETVRAASRSVETPPPFLASRLTAAQWS